MLPRQIDIPLTTDGAGACTALSAAFSGRVLAVKYTKVDFTNGADLTITTSRLAQPILTLTDPDATVFKYPRVLVQDQAGVDTTLREPVYVINDQVKVVVAAGGAAHTGTVTLIIG